MRLGRASGALGAHGTATYGSTGVARTHCAHCGAAQLPLVDLTAPAAAYAGAPSATLAAIHSAPSPRRCASARFVRLRSPPPLRNTPSPSRGRADRQRMKRILSVPLVMSLAIPACGRLVPEPEPEACPVERCKRIAIVPAMPRAMSGGEDAPDHWMRITNRSDERRERHGDRDGPRRCRNGVQGVPARLTSLRKRAGEDAGH